MPALVPEGAEAMVFPFEVVYQAMEEPPGGVALPVCADPS